MLTWAITATGISVPTQAQLLAYYQQQYLAIYGVDLTQQDPSSPDNQWVNIQVQAALDLQDFLIQIYNSFDPDNAIGVVLDQRVAINGIQRQAGTFTITNVTLVLSQSVNLYGLDQTAQPVYTVSDSSGNQWQLMFTQLGLGGGTHILAFQAANPGAVSTVPNTITVPVTIVLGVTSINNPTSYTSLGINEESDAALKIRRQKSIAQPGQGYYAGLLGALENISGVTFAYIEENTTASANADGVPGHSIWVIVGGSPQAAAIANAIYVYRNAGCGMYGSQNYFVTQVDGSSFEVFWDNVSTQALFIVATLTSLDGVHPPNIAAIQTGLVTSFTPAPAQEVNVNGLATLIQDIDPNSLVTLPGFNTSTTQYLVASSLASSGIYQINYGVNGSISKSTGIAANAGSAVIQSAIRGIASANLGSVTVSGNFNASGTVQVVMTGVTALELLGVSNNSLLNAGGTAVSFNFFSQYTNTLTPSSKKNQFLVSGANIILIPMILYAPGVAYVFSGSNVVTNTTVTVVHATNLQFTGLGGYGILTYSVSTATGGSINASTGLYTAGSAGTDAVTVTDQLGNTATCTVTVS